MKHLKKLTALVLAVCMLIGMPLSMDVAATGTPNANSSAMPFQLAQAMLVPAAWNTGLDPDRSVALYFNGDVTIDITNTKAYITLVNGSGFAAYVDPVNGKKNQGPIVSVWDATISRCTALGSVNNYVVTLNDVQTRNGHELTDTVTEILDLARKTGLKPVVRLAEGSDPVNGTQLPNNRLLSIYEGTTYLASTPNGEDGGGCNANGQVIDKIVSANPTDEEKAMSRETNCYDYVDISITTATEAPTVRYVEYDPSASGNNFRIILNNGLGYSNRGSGNTPIHIRVVNSKGQVIYTNGSTYVTENQVVTSSGITSGYYALGNYNNAITNVHGLNLEKILPQGTAISTLDLRAIPRASFDPVSTSTTHDWTATYNTCVAACNTLNARNDGETYTVAFVIDENDSSTAYDGDCVYSANGESANNWRIDALWKAGTYIPLTATHSNAALGINDRIIVPILNTNEMGDAALGTANEFALKNVAVVSSPGQADRVVIEFTKPISKFTYSYSGIRLYESNGYVGTHTYNGEAVYKQWSVNEWARFDATGTRWIGTLTNAFGCDTFAEIQTWLVNNNYATNNNGNFALSGNRRLEFSIADAGTDTQNNRSVDLVVADDGTTLFANDSPFGTLEERAGRSWNTFQTYDSVHIEEVKLYANKYVLIDFDQDVTFDTKLFFNALCIYDNATSDLAGCDAFQSSYGSYNQAFNGTDTTGNIIFQKSFSSLEYYGNRKDILLASIAESDYTWLENHLKKANTWSANSGGSSTRFAFALRLQDYKDSLTYNVNYAIQGIAAADNIYSFLRAAKGAWSTVYKFPTVANRKIADLTDATLINKNQAVVSFSAVISSAKASAFSLISADGSKIYPATAASVSGTSVTLTFNNPVYEDGMKLRISGGSDYMIDTSLVKTLSGAAILANETESSAIIAVNIADAVAGAKVNDIPYISFANAWAAKKTGDTVSLYNDTVIPSNRLSVPAGITLDLHGHTLTTENMIAFGNVIDSTNGAGLLGIDKSNANAFALLQDENIALPLYDAAKVGYRFFTYDIVNRGTRTITTDGTVTALKYGIMLDFPNEDAYTLLTKPENIDAKLTFDLTIRLPHSKSSTLIYTLPQWTLRQYATAVLNNSGNTIVIKVGGIDEVMSNISDLPSGAVIDAHSSITSGTGVTHDSTKEIYHVGITPAQAAVNWINTQINNNSLISFTYDGVAFPTNWTKEDSGAGSATSDWTRTVTYTNTKDGTVKLTLTINFDAEHAALDWVGNWTFTRASYTNRFSGTIQNIRILNAKFPVKGAVMTTARQGGMKYIQDYQPYSVNLANTTSYSMSNYGGRSTQGAWPYFDLTSAHNTYGIMGAIGWTGNWICDFAYDSSAGTVNVSAGMKNTNYQMANSESLRTPSMVIQFFEGTQDDGHNAWRQLMLDNYTPNDVNGNPVRYAPITINTWGGRGTEGLLNTMNKIKDSGQYFEYQWIDAGWYGDYTSLDTYAKEWSQQRGNWYYNPGYANSSGTKTDPANNLYLTQGGFDELKAWHAANGTGLIVWFEPGQGMADTKMGTSANSSTPYKFTATYKKPQADGTLKQVTETVSWNNGYFMKDTTQVNYGDANALAFIKAVVLHYLDDMGCYFYRQDYNFDPTDNSNITKDGWRNEDQRSIDSFSIWKPSTRTGVSEIKYVTGHYDLLDTIIATGRQIDNCASGGRLLDIEMAKRSIPLWRTDYSVSGKGVYTLASGIRSQGANLSWWLPISGGMGSSEGVTSSYGFRSYMGSGATMGYFSDQTYATKMINEMKNNRELMLGDYYILQQGLHEGLTYESYWKEADASKDLTDTTDAAYEFYREDLGKGYLVTFRPNHSTKTSQTYKLRGLDAHANYLVEDADTGETHIYTGRFLMETGIRVVSPKPRTSHMIYFTKQ